MFARAPVGAGDDRGRRTIAKDAELRCAGIHSRQQTARQPCPPEATRETVALIAGGECGNMSFTLTNTLRGRGVL